jgi:hypothetical protein
MSIYFNTITNEYPRYIGDLELLGWSVGNDLPEGWVEVEYTEPPYAEENMKVIPFPEFKNNKWTLSWSIVPITEEDIFKRQNAKDIRDKLFNR